MKLAKFTVFLSFIALPAFAADVVVPVDSVSKHVNVRLDMDAKSDVVGRLKQGSSLPLESSADGWHQVELDDDAYGFISADWTVVLSEEDFAARQSPESADEQVDEQVAEKAETEIVDDANSDVDTEVVAGAPIDAEPDSVVVEEPEVIEDEHPIVIATVAKPSTDVEEAVVAAMEPESEPPAVAEESTLAENEEAALPDTASVEDVSEDVEQVFADAEQQVELAADERAEVDSQEAVNDAALTAVVEPVAAVATATVLSGPPGPPGPPGRASVEGSVDYLMKFTTSTIGGNSQVFDDGNNVGIGTDEPKQRLEVNGNIQIHERNSNVAGLLLTQASGDTGYIMHNRANSLTLGSGSVDRMTIDGDGNVGIGMARPSHPIEMASGAYVSAGGVWTNSSSREKKENIVELTPEEALMALAELEPVRYNYRVDDTEDYVGFIAEDVPELVASTERTTLSPMDIVAVLTKVVQQQQQQIDKLEARLEAEGR